MWCNWRWIPALILAANWTTVLPTWADGKVFAPRSYAGSLAESTQEAVVIFHTDKDGQGVEDLILKITVAGRADKFAWVVPLPREPHEAVAKEDPALFAELHNYVQHRLAQRHLPGKSGSKAEAKNSADEGPTLTVLSREVVGTFDVALLREETAGGLATWLAENGYEGLPTDAAASAVINSYRARGYVFAAIKVADTARAAGGNIPVHPLRFTFRTGGRDGIFYPMRLTGLQTEPFTVNLYVFYGAWLNPDLNGFGFRHRGWELVHRDWDGPNCRPNAGKAWSAPSSDSYLHDVSGKIGTVTGLFQARHAGRRFYLTNIRGSFRPKELQSWTDDTWFFPYYTNRAYVPLDARPGGPAAVGYRDLPEIVNLGKDGADSSATAVEPEPLSPMSAAFWGRLFGVAAVMALCGVTVVALSRRPS